MPAREVKAYLDKNNINYDIVPHATTYTAQETAASAHVPGKELAKTVIAKIDGKMAMAVLPASCQVDFEHLREIAGAQKVELATEQEFRNTFPGCEVGAMPPFGNLYGMDVFVAEELAEDTQISFNAGTHSELIRMSFADYERLVNPKVVALAV
jgi:Ala-tRNA(Pro) deacylase